VRLSGTCFSIKGAEGTAGKTFSAIRLAASQFCFVQVLMGSYPIAQLREPFSVVQFLAERLNLVKLLKLQHPEKQETWSAFDVCDGMNNFMSLS
jgi:hypothetical protein